MDQTKLPLTGGLRELQAEVLRDKADKELSVRVSNAKLRVIAAIGRIASDIEQAGWGVTFHLPNSPEVIVLSLNMESVYGPGADLGKGIAAIIAEARAQAEKAFPKAEPSTGPKTFIETAAKFVSNEQELKGLVDVLQPAVEPLPNSQGLQPVVADTIRAMQPGTAFTIFSLLSKLPGKFKGADPQWVSKILCRFNNQGRLIYCAGKRKSDTRVGHSSLNVYRRLSDEGVVVTAAMCAEADAAATLRGDETFEIVDV